MSICNMIGNLTKAPELVHTNTGKIVCNFSIAVKNNWGKETSFFVCQAWEKTAEKIAEFFIKGSKISVDGWMKQERWEKDGAQKSKIFMIVERFSFCEKKSEGQPATQSNSNYGY